MVITNRGTEKRIPLVNTAEDINRFLKKRVDGRAVVEVSAYEPRPVDFRIRLPRGEVF